MNTQNLGLTFLFLSLRSMGVKKLNLSFEKNFLIMIKSHLIEDTDGIKQITNLNRWVYLLNYQIFE